MKPIYWFVIAVAAGAAIAGLVFYFRKKRSPNTLPDMTKPGAGAPGNAGGTGGTGSGNGSGSDSVGDYIPPVTLQQPAMESAGGGMGIINFQPVNLNGSGNKTGISTGGVAPNGTGVGNVSLVNGGNNFSAAPQLVVGGINTMDSGNFFVNSL